jgi:site-specific DNA-methyltransferase (adenine-specific)
MKLLCQLALEEEDMNKLFYGDNLVVLRDSIGDETIDLIYLDPPFNSSANYNILFKSPTSGESSHSQIEAFEDTWHWGHEAQKEFDELVVCSNSELSELIQALRHFLKENDMMAYLTMMASRLLELHRVLKPTGSLYLHCDPTASHYLKVLLDSVFGVENFKNEIIWRRTGSHNSAKRFGPIHDVILYYSKSPASKFYKSFRPYMKGHVESYFKKEDAKGKYWTNSLTGAGTRNGESGKEWKGYNPTASGRHWAIPSELVDALGIDPDLSVHEKLDAMDEAGVIDKPSADGNALPTYRQYLDRGRGIAIQDIWAYQPHTGGSQYGTLEGIDEDVRWMSAQGDSERLGYPTQKPLGLLERIVKSGSKEGEVVLDPFCGCGTAVHAAQKLNRQWIGIDITHLAVTLIERRLKDAFPKAEFEVHGTPKDLDAAIDLASRDKYQFQWWAVSLVGAQPYQGKKKGADSGIDGLIYFRDDSSGDFKKIIVSVKGGDNVNVAMIRDLEGVMQREKAAIGLFVTLAEPSGPMTKEALGKNLYHSPSFPSMSIPSVQILTIKGLLDGTERAIYPNLLLADVGFRRIGRETSATQDELF